MRVTLGSIAFIVIGAAMVVLALYGVYAGSVPFPARGPRLLVMLSNTNDVGMFWFVESFYLLGGVVVTAFGIQSAKDD